MMPSYSGKRTYEMTTKKWGGRNQNQNQRRDDRRPPLQNRIAGGSRPMVNPWENGVTPGMQSSLLGQGSFAQSIPSSYLLNSGMNRGSFGAVNYGGGFGTGANKMRPLDRMGGFDDQRGRGLLPSPSNAPLLGVAPPTAFVPPGRGTEFLQQRMGNPWDSSSFRSGVPRGLNSGYYPSNRGRQDNSRKFLKAKRPQNNKSSSSSTSNKSGSSKEGRGGRTTKGSSTSKSPSKGEDKDRDSSSAHSKSSKQGGDLPPKRERSDKDDKDDEEEEEEDEKEKEKESVEERKESVDRDVEEKMDDDSGEKNESEERNEEERKEKEKQQEEQFPVEALYCHICELDSFSSKKGYIRHLQGITHAKMAEMFHAKNAATLELLNISAKLAEMRQRDKVLRRTGKKGQPVAKTTEQILVQKWLKVGSCCGTKYKSPFGLEEHKLSIHHLKAKFTQKHKDEEKGEKSEEKTEDDDTEESKEVKKESSEELFLEDSHDDVLKLSALIEQAQKEAEENPTSMENLPAYNPSVMMGLEFIDKELRFRCRICKGPGFKSLECHCQLHSHFDNIASHLNKIEDMKREEKRKQEEEEAEAAAEAKKEQEKLQKEKEEQAQKEKLKKESEEEGREEDGEGGLSSEFITLDDCAKDKSDDEEMDEDAIVLGEEEERILNAKEEAEEEEEEAEAAVSENEGGGHNEDDDGLMESEIFEEIGEKIDFDGDLKKQMENGDEEDEAQEAEPPQKKPVGTPRGRRGRSRGRGKWGK